MSIYNSPIAGPFLPPGVSKYFIGHTNNDGAFFDPTNYLNNLNLGLESSLMKPISSGILSQISLDSSLYLGNSRMFNTMAKMQGEQMFSEGYNKLKEAGQLKYNGNVINSNDPPEKLSFSDKFNNSTFGKNYDKWEAANQAVNLAATAAFGTPKEYQGDKGAITAGMDGAYDAVLQTLSLFGPLGKTASLFMGANKALGNVMKGLGGGTDGMTATDAIMGSAFLQMTPFGLINGFLGKNADTITRDEEAFDIVGGSYGGTSAAVDDALKKSGKKYGAFSAGARKQANAEIADAKNLQNMIANIADVAQDLIAVLNYMSSVGANKRATELAGGYKQAAARIGRQGMKFENLDRARHILNKPINFIEELPVEYHSIKAVLVPDIPILRPVEVPDIVGYMQEGGKVRTIDELIEYAKEVNPRFIQRMSEPVKSVSWQEEKLDDDGYTRTYDVEGIHMMAYKVLDDGTAIVFPMIQEINGQLKKFENPEEAYLVALENNNILHLYNEEEAKLFSESNDSEHSYKKGWPQFFRQFKLGGSFNVIPDGALHARKNNIEVEGITKKGIPVVSEEDGGKIEQLAEIELGEIILRLSVTKKLEELAKKNDDESAIKAGKLLVKEILENTVDNTNLLI